MRIWQFAHSSLVAYDVVSVGKRRRVGGAVCLLYLCRHSTPKAAKMNSVSALSVTINCRHILIFKYIHRGSPKCVFIFCTPLITPSLQVTGCRNGLRLWRTAANILTQTDGTADKGWPSVLRVRLWTHTVSERHYTYRDNGKTSHGRWRWQSLMFPHSCLLLYSPPVPYGMSTNPKCFLLANSTCYYQNFYGENQ